MTYSRAPSLGLVLYLLKNSTADFFRFHQSHRQSLGKLQSLDQLPPEELKEVILGQDATPLCLSLTLFRFLLYLKGYQRTELGILYSVYSYSGMHCFRPCLWLSLCSCAKAWCRAQEGWRKSHQSKETSWPRDAWSSLSTTEPSCWPSAPVSFGTVQV